MVKTTLKIEAPISFNFKRTVNSHGWYDLPPFELDRENCILTRVFDVEGEPPLTAEIREAENDLKISVFGEAGEKAIVKIVRDFRHILRLDEDFSAFYELTNSVTDFDWIFQQGAGRLLRSPTVFEDLVKTICTTNCSWALTRKMIVNLVEKLGETTSDGRKSFPTAAKMAEQEVDFYKNEIRAGYRAAYFQELAQKVVSGALDVESWLVSDLPTEELKKQIKSVKGAGDYAAENLLKLLGRYDGLALDSYLRMRFTKIRNGGEVCEDRQIRLHYEKFGSFAGLAIWCDMTRDWL